MFNLFKRRNPPKAQSPIQGCKTVDDILTLDDVEEIVNELQQKRTNIKNVILIFDDEDNIHYRWSGDTRSRVNYMLDVTKKAMLED